MDFFELLELFVIKCQNLAFNNMHDFSNDFWH